jgi:hypothetical protein
VPSATFGAQRRDALTVEAPAGQALRPELGRVRTGGAVPGPRLEVCGGEIGEREHQIPQVALRVDDQGGHVIEERLLQQHHAEAGLARAGHAHDHAVGGEVVTVDLDGLPGSLVGGGVHGLPEVEAALGHGGRG